MPPKVRITREAILDAALDITRRGGISSVNAREIAKVLGCSIQPIFRNFQSMDNLRADLYTEVCRIHDEHVESGMGRHPIPFLGLGLAYIDFAATERNLFTFLFMSDEFKGRSFIEMIKDEENREVVAIISAMTGLDISKSQELFMDIWLMTHGIASLVATNDLVVDEEEISKILKDAFLGIKYRLTLEEN